MWGLILFLFAYRYLEYNSSVWTCIRIIIVITYILPIVKQVGWVFFFYLQRPTIVYNIFPNWCRANCRIRQRRKKVIGRKKNVLFLLPPPPLRWCVNRTLIMDCLGHYCRTLFVLIWLHLSYRDQYTTRRADHFSRPAIVSSVVHSIRRKTPWKKNIVLIYMYILYIILFPATSGQIQGRCVVYYQVESTTRLENDIYLILYII